VTRSVVIGGDGTTNDEEDLENWSSQPQRACDGGDGIYAPDASLLSINDSEVRGGDGGDFTFNCVDGGTDSGPSEIYAGNGGNGVVGDCYVSNSTITAGSGGDAMYNGCGFGIEHDGVAGTDVIGTRIDLADRLAVGVARPGATSTLDGSGFTANGAVLLLLGDGPVGPLSLSKLGLYFLDLRTIVGPISADGTGAFHLSATIPDDQCLIGAAIAMQASDGGPLSEPELVVIQP
jgi:hypothetical protein